MTTKRP